MPELLEAFEEQDRVELEINRRICRGSLYGTLVYLWDTIIPDPFIYNWHIEYICNEMQKVGQWVIDRSPALYDLIINVPPGTTKSTICSIFFHVWLWINDPSIRLISGSYSSELSTEHAVKARDVLKSQKFQELFPHRVIFKGDQDNKTFYQNIKNGSRAAVSVGGTVIGRHAHIITLDDIIDPAKSKSDVYREAAIDWLDKSISTRKIDKKNTPTVLIMQRLHEMDPTGHLLEKAQTAGKKIRHICLPGENVLDNISPPRLRMLYKGGLLDSGRMDDKVLNGMKIDMGSREYSGQVLQSPMSPGGNIIKRDWIKTYTELPKQRPTSIIQSWDTAYKKDEQNAYQCCGTWYEYSHGYYLEHVFVKRLIYPELKQMVIALDSQFKPNSTLVEDKSSGTPVIQELELDTKINFVKILPDLDKIARAHAASPTFEAGNVYIRGDADWTALIIEQLTMFPNCRIKDIMDMVSQYINYIRQHQSVSVSQLRGGRTSNTTRGYTHG